MISFHNVSKIYGHSWYALRDVNLEIAQGEFVFIQGPTGAGKTTLLKLIYREELPTRGEVTIGGRNLRKLPAKEIPKLRRHIGIIFQDFKLLPDRTVYENLEFSLMAINFPRDRIEDKIFSTLTKLGMMNKIHNFPHQLSGGEQQKVAIARAIAKEPELILADEPTGNIDHESAEEITKIFLELNNQGKTLIMATHDIELPKVLKRRTVKLVAGKITEDTKGE